MKFSASDIQFAQKINQFFMQIYQDGAFPEQSVGNSSSDFPEENIDKISANLVRLSCVLNAEVE